MKAKYIGDPRNPGEAKNLPEETTAFGLVFERGKWVDVPDHLEAKFVGNSHFETKGKADSDDGAEAQKADTPANPTGAPAVREGSREREGPRGSGSVAVPTGR